MKQSTTLLNDPPSLNLSWANWSVGNASTRSRDAFLSSKFMASLWVNQNKMESLSCMYQTITIIDIARILTRKKYFWWKKYAKYTHYRREKNWLFTLRTKLSSSTTPPENATSRIKSTENLMTTLFSWHPTTSKSTNFRTLIINCNTQKTARTSPWKVSSQFFRYRNWRATFNTLLWQQQPCILSS